MDWLPKFTCACMYTRYKTQWEFSVTVAGFHCSLTDHMTGSNPFENSCSNTHCEDCHDTSRDLWPHLNITLEHYNELKYGIVISWKQPGNHCTFSLWLKFSQWMNPVLLCCFSVNVTGYVLLITMQPRSGRCGGGDLTGLNMCNCINITTAVGQIFVKSCRHVAMDALLY